MTNQDLSKRGGELLWKRINKKAGIPLEDSL